MTNNLPLDAIRSAFGSIDIYLFDQLMKERIRPGMRILDAGCGHGRNLVGLMQAGFDVWGIDRSPVCVASARKLANPINPSLAENFHEANLADLPFDDSSFDFIICSAVLHFSSDETEFEAGLSELGRVLAPGGILFARLTSTIGIETLVQPLGNRRFHLPDGSDRFCVDQDYLLAWTEKLNARLLDPIKTTNVQNQRCMTTWVLQKS